MPTITDWLMVGITFVYVIATIFICIANLKSARASLEQISEMRCEHDENIRLRIMPYFEVNCNEFDSKTCKTLSTIDLFTDVREFMKKENKTALSFLNIKNIGMNSAISIYIALEYGDISSTLPGRNFVDLAIHPGEEYHLKIMSVIPPTELDDSNYYRIGDNGTAHKVKNAKIILEFDDIQHNHYLQITHVKFSLLDDERDILPFCVSKDAKIDTSKFSRKCTVCIENCFTEPPVFVKKG